MPFAYRRFVAAAKIVLAPADSLCPINKQPVDPHTRLLLVGFLHELEYFKTVHMFAEQLSGMLIISRVVDNSTKAIRIGIDRPRNTW